MEHRNVAKVVGAVVVLAALAGCGGTTSPTRPATTKSGQDTPIGVIAKPNSPLSATYFTLTAASQNDTRWACDELGTCSDMTMGKCPGHSPGGCAVTALYMLSTANRSVAYTPADLNRWLTTNGGYASGCYIRWSRAADYDGPFGLTWVGTNTLSSPAALKALLDKRYLIVASSRRFASHWVAVTPGYGGSGASTSNFGYLDPWDGTCRVMGDGWVGTGAELRVYRMQ
jgi:hypothetical protein